MTCAAEAALQEVIARAQAVAEALVLIEATHAAIVRMRGGVILNPVDPATQAILGIVINLGTDELSN